jgi:hypothetical protein
MNERPPTGCEYETEGRACPNVARVRLTFRDATVPAGISGEPVKYFGHACHGHLAQARRVPDGIKLESEEKL